MVKLLLVEHFLTKDALCRLSYKSRSMMDAPWHPGCAAAAQRERSYDTR